MARREVWRSPSAVGLNAKIDLVGLAKVFFDECLQALEPLFLPIFEDAGLRYFTTDKIAAGIFIRILERDEVGLFFNHHDNALVAVRIAADVAKLAGILVDEEASLARFNIAEIVDAHGKLADVLLFAADQKEREAESLGAGRSREVRSMHRQLFGWGRGVS